MAPERELADGVLSPGRTLPSALDQHLEALARSLRQLVSARQAAGTYSSPAAAAELRAHLRAELRAVCTMARDAGIPPEAIIIRLKATWHTVPDAASRGPADAQLAQMITACIQEYYD